MNAIIREDDIQGDAVPLFNRPPDPVEGGIFRHGRNSRGHGSERLEYKLAARRWLPEGSRAQGGLTRVVAGRARYPFSSGI